MKSESRMARSNRRARFPAAGFVLPIVLVIVGLLIVTMASFIFFVRAETAGTRAERDSQQARLTAESGLEEIIAMIRKDKHNPQVWFDNPARLRNALVWSDAYSREDDPVKKTGARTEVLESKEGVAPAWRYSITAPSESGLEGTARYGVTPESSKLNLNAATDAQIEQLLTPLLLNLQIENAPELIAALLDWRDADDESREAGAENAYYNTLTPAYSVKSGPFDTLEEVLLVKGFNAAILYGEDTNRNGLLDPNEDDGDASFPMYDDGDGVLDQGIAPFLTVLSRDPDTALDNKPRINLRGDIATINTQAAAQFQEGEISPATLQFIATLKQKKMDFSKIGSAAELYQGPGASTDDDDEGLTPPASQPGSQPASSQPGGGGASDPATLLAGSPVTLEEMPFVMDRFTVRDPKTTAQGIPGLINVNTAPQQVLMLIPGMSPTAAANIIALRKQLPAETLKSPAWPLTAGAVGTKRYHAIAPFITTKAYQFHVEVLGYADHSKLFRRYEWVLEMIGPMAQVKYFRDLTALGFAWPVDDDSVQVSQ